MGLTVRHARQGGRAGSRRAILNSRRAKARGSSWQPAPASTHAGPPPAQGPSARVVHVEVESLVAQQRVGVVELEQVDALAGVVVAAGLHIPVAVAPVHGHHLPVAAPQGAPGASLYIAHRDRVCVSKTGADWDVSAETGSVRRWTWGYALLQEGVHSLSLGHPANE